MSRKRPDPARRGKYSEELEQIVADIATGYVQEFRDTPEVARKRAEMAMGRIQSQSAGCGLYISKGHLWYVDETHRRIYRRFTGANHKQLALEFGLSERQIYTIIERVGQEEFDRRQGKLFG